MYIIWAWVSDHATLTVFKVNSRTKGHLVVGHVDKLCLCVRACFLLGLSSIPSDTRCLRQNLTVNSTSVSPLSFSLFNKVFHATLSCYSVPRFLSPVRVTVTSGIGSGPPGNGDAAPKWYVQSKQAWTIQSFISSQINMVLIVMAGLSCPLYDKKYRSKTSS